MESGAGRGHTGDVRVTAQSQQTPHLRSTLDNKSHTAPGPAQLGLSPIVSSAVTQTHPGIVTFPQTDDTSPRWVLGVMNKEGSRTINRYIMSVQLSLLVL